VVHQVSGDAAAYSTRKRKDRRQLFFQGSPQSEKNDNQHEDREKPKYSVASSGKVSTADGIFDPHTTQLHPRQKETYENERRQADGDSPGTVWVTHRNP